MDGNEQAGAGRSNIILIGMPGAGKSTVGVLLARQTGKDFLDTDVLIQMREGRSLQSIVDSEGYLALRAIEERVLLSLGLENCVVATGGSAAYSKAAMLHLRSSGIVVFMDVPLDVLRARVRDFETRGIARRAGQGFDELFEERRGLYLRYAEHRVDCGAADHEAVCRRIQEVLARGSEEP